MAKETELGVTFTFYLRTKSQVGADLIIQVGPDSILLCSVIYKFVTTNTFNCYGTKACIRINLECD